MIKRKKRRVNGERTRALNRCLKLAIEICKARSGGRCEICMVNGVLRDGAIVDHCFSRMVKKLLIDWRNLTYLCGDCNNSKTAVQHSFKTIIGQKGMAKEVHKYVRLREGERWYYQAGKESKSHSGFQWNILDLEKKEAEMKKFLKRLREMGAWW